MKTINTSLNQFEDHNNLPAPISTPIHWLTQLFGCWHKKMSSPFTREGETYCTCMQCGAQRNFDTELSKNIGPYYRSSVTALYKSSSVTKKLVKDR